MRSERIENKGEDNLKCPTYLPKKQVCRTHDTCVQIDEIHHRECKKRDKNNFIAAKQTKLPNQNRENDEKLGELKPITTLLVEG